MIRITIHNMSTGEERRREADTQAQADAIVAAAEERWPEAEIITTGVPASAWTVTV